MELILVDVESQYAKDKNLKKEDVEALLDWVNKQPHLPKINGKWQYYKLTILEFHFQNYKQLHSFIVVITEMRRLKSPSTIFSQLKRHLICLEIEIRYLHQYRMPLGLRNYHLDK